MSTPILLIDGYNLLNAIIVKGLEGGELRDFRYQMLRQLDRYRVQTGKYRVWVVFGGRRTKDEARRTKKAGSVRVFFSKPPAGADVLIEEQCRSNSGNVILVTSHGELRRRTSEYVKRSIGSGYFLRNYLSIGKDLGES